MIPEDEKYLVAVLSIYGLSKIHKPEMTIRPIIDNNHSLTYKLSRWLTKWKFSNKEHSRSGRERNKIELNTADRRQE